MIEPKEGGWLYDAFSDLCGHPLAWRSLPTRHADVAGWEPMTGFPIARRDYRMRDGVNIVADVGGNPAAPTIVLMHGGGQTRHSWSRALEAAVNAGYHGINFDARGHGESDWSPDGNYSLTVRAKDLGEVLQGTQGPVAYVGASMGGATALFAVGENVEPGPAALIMVDIVPKPSIEGTDRIATFMKANPQGFASLDEAADAIAAYNTHRPRPKNPVGLAKNLRLRSDGRYYWHWDPRMLTGPTAPDPGAMAGPLTAYAAQVKVPTLLVRGLASDVVTDENIAHFQSLIPDLEIFDVPGAGHMVAGDSNDMFNHGVIEFLKRHMPVHQEGPCYGE